MAQCSPTHRPTEREPQLSSLDKKPTMEHTNAVSYRLLDPSLTEDLAVCQAVFRRTPSFVYPTGGRPATDADVSDMFSRLPSRVSPVDVQVCAVEEKGATCGFYAVLRKYPDDQCAYIALLILVDEAQGRALGAQVLRHIESQAQSCGCVALAAAVDSKNENAVRFWLKQGFVEEFRKLAAGFMGEAIFISKRGF